MATALAPAPVPPRRRALHSGTTLVVTEVARHVNIPAVDGLVHQVQDWITTLKPRILQAPERNDQEARELSTQVLQYSQVVEDAAISMGSLSTQLQNEYAEKFLLELQQFNDYLAGVRAELQALQEQQFRNKLARQAELRSYLETKEREIANKITMFCLSNGLSANCVVTQSREETKQLVMRVRELEYQIDLRPRCPEITMMANV